MDKVPNGEEILLKISTGWVGCTNVDRRQTNDRRTGDSIIASVNVNVNVNVHCDVDAAQRSCDVLLDVAIVMELVRILLIILTQTTQIRWYFVRMCWSHFKYFCVSIMRLHCNGLSFHIPKLQNDKILTFFVYYFVISRKMLFRQPLYLLSYCVS